MPPLRLRKSTKSSHRFNVIYLIYGTLCLVFLSSLVSLILVSVGKWNIVSTNPDMATSSNLSSLSKSPEDIKTFDDIAYKLPEGFQSMLKRAKSIKDQCDAIPKVSYQPNSIDLKPFGIVESLEFYRPQTLSEADQWNCQVPPPTECDVERFSVVFLGYGADRLHGMKTQIRGMLGKKPYSDMVEEVILVWNNPTPLNESGSSGEILYQWSKEAKNPFHPSEPNRFRVFYPIDHGFSSSLLNRYHPMIQPKSKALLYYDDDGPFYSERAIRSNFELWKRNSNIQTGAMARAFTLSERQQAEKSELLGGPTALDDQKFISHCRSQGDSVRYDYRYFENFHANMVSLYNCSIKSKRLMIIFQST
jgi:Glycosyl transferase family 64 domain